MVNHGIVTLCASLSNAIHICRTNPEDHIFSTRLATLTSSSAKRVLARASIRNAQSTSQLRLSLDKWDIYVNDRLVYKKAFEKGELKDLPLVSGATGVAVQHYYFAQGSERSAYRCFEVGPGASLGTPGAAAAGARPRVAPAQNLVTVGLPLVAKETLFEEELMDSRFHRRIAKVQFEAECLALLFNDAVRRFCSKFVVIKNRQ